MASMAGVLLAAVVVISICVHNSARAETVTVRPSSSTVMVGGDITINCTVRKNSSEVVQWINDVKVISRGTQIVADSLVSRSQMQRLRITGEHEAGAYNLNINNVQPEDAGHYQCGYFSIADRKTYFSPAVIRVILHPLCELFPQNVPRMPGYTIQMICTSQNGQQSNTLMWLRNGQPLQGVTNGPTQTVEHLLTEDDYDQPFTCVERMSPLAYVPHCSITPLRRTYRPVHIVTSSEPLSVGDVSHLTCLTNETLENPIYTWLVGAKEAFSSSNGFSYGPVTADDINTTVTCEVYRQDGMFYGSDGINITVLLDTVISVDSSAGPNTSFAQPHPSDAALGTADADRRPLPITEHVSSTTPTHLNKDPVLMPNMFEGYMAIFIAVAATVGLLLIIAIFCLTLVLTRGNGSAKNNSIERSDSSSYSDFRGEGVVDDSTAEANILNEQLEAAHGGTKPHYFTLEPNGSRKERTKERRSSETISVAYTKVSKKRKSSKKFTNSSGGIDEGEVDIVNGNGSASAYAVTTVAKPNTKRPMSARRPLPERPDGNMEYKTPIRSYSESRKDHIQSSGKTDKKRLAKKAGNHSMDETSTTKTYDRNSSADNIQTLIIDSDYTEVAGLAAETADPRLNERPYEFSTVYDAVGKCEEEPKIVSKCGPDSGYHDSSSSDGTEQEVDDSDGQRSEQSRSSSFRDTTLVKVEAEANVYASLDDCSTLKEQSK